MEARDYILAIRRAGGLTQAQVAERTGIAQPTISKIERGDVHDVRSRSYRALQALHAEIEAASGAGAAGTAPASQGAAHG